MTGTALSLAHDLAFKECWGTIPNGITGGKIITASEDMDKHKATDLIVCATSEHEVAMRVRGFAYLQNKEVIDWSVRTQASGGGTTEIDKLRAGFCALYFMGCSATYANAGAARHAPPCRTAQLLHAYLIDLNAVREAKLLDELVIHPNGDGTAGGYLTFKKLDKFGCILWTTPDIAHLRTRKTFALQKELPL